MRFGYTQDKLSFTLQRKNPSVQMQEKVMLYSKANTITKQTPITNPLSLKTPTRLNLAKNAKSTKFQSRTIRNLIDKNKEVTFYMNKKLTFI